MNKKRAQALRALEEEKKQLLMYKTYGIPYIGSVDMIDFGTLKNPSLPYPAGTEDNALLGKNHSLSLSGMAAQLYNGTELPPGKRGFMNFAMLSLITFLFEAFFLVISYFMLK